MTASQELPNKEEGDAPSVGVELRQDGSAEEPAAATRHLPSVTPQQRRTRTTTERAISGAPNCNSVAHPQVCWVRHRILVIKIFYVAHLAWCATEFSHFAPQNSEKIQKMQKKI